MQRTPYVCSNVHDHVVFSQLFCFFKDNYNSCFVPRTTVEKELVLAALSVPTEFISSLVDTSSTCVGGNPVNHCHTYWLHTVLWLDTSVLARYIDHRLHMLAAAFVGCLHWLRMLATYTLVGSLVHRGYFPIPQRSTNTLINAFPAHCLMMVEFYCNTPMGSHSKLTALNLPHRWLKFPSENDNDVLPITRD